MVLPQYLHWHSKDFKFWKALFQGSSQKTLRIILLSQEIENPFAYRFSVGIPVCLSGSLSVSLYTWLSICLFSWSAKTCSLIWSILIQLGPKSKHLWMSCSVLMIIFKVLQALSLPEINQITVGQSFERKIIGYKFDILYPKMDPKLRICGSEALQ